MKTEEKNPFVEPAELEWFELMVKQATPIDPENVPRLVHTVRQLWEAMAVLAEEPRFTGIPASLAAAMRGGCLPVVSGADVPLTKEENEKLRADLEARFPLLEIPAGWDLSPLLHRAAQQELVEAKTLEVPRATYDANGSPVEEEPLRFTRAGRVHVVGENPVPEAILSRYVRDPACIEQWPECEQSKYDPHCCRFPKSCSCLIRVEDLAKREAEEKAKAEVPHVP